MVISIAIVYLHHTSHLAYTTGAGQHDDGDE